MNMDGQKQTYEQFKADIFQWKDTHREEYRRFAKMMADGNEMQYLAVCRDYSSRWAYRCLCADGYYLEF